ncbi:MAG: 2-hydroxyacyl-CoA dehydratase [Clostridia bacterium]|nr:2-hydroxyacyl-CoA dehydratase [Clostridia bacterium]
MNMKYSIGVDVGSTTVKSVVLSENYEIIYSVYTRHFSKVKETVLEQLKKIFEKHKGEYKISITGSAGLGLSSSAEMPFVQEVYSASLAIKRLYPDADCAVELGGEDAKILFLTGGTEQRMNGSCAGGTGAFIDQMATLLKVSGDQLDWLALKAEKKYPIASRCGVFAKSDIQPLLNQGASLPDVSASIFQAVVDQTVAGLAQGRKIEGKVLFLGGPLHFYKALQNSFKETLDLDDEHAIFPELAPCFMAYGAAVYASKNSDFYSSEAIINKIENSKQSSGVLSFNPLFDTDDEYNEFLARHSKADIEKNDISTYEGNAYLGVDAGSTTTKMVLLDENGKMLFSHYTENSGKPLDVVSQKLRELYDIIGDRIKIVSSAVTGYGEELLKSGLKIDFGIVETVAHFTAALSFCPDVDFIIDIGGQDIKCFKIKNKAIDNIMLNEACSSGCGSFIQTFANALGYPVDKFSKLGLFAKNPVELGSRCTVFMNSAVKQAQKDGASIEDISAGISSSVVKNAIYKVIRAKSPDELGKHVVVQGGTFLNDAVLRSFERELGINVIRPSISGLMGAYGAALYAKKKSSGVSTIVTKKELEEFSYKSSTVTCKGCTAHCSLNILTFADGRRLISGNRCEKGLGKKESEILPDIFAYKYSYLTENIINTNEKPKAKVGLPLCLGYYDQLPMWNVIFNELGFETVISDMSTRKTFVYGQHTIPSDTVCYPAKLAHGHILNLLDKGVDFIFYPCESYNIDEGDSDNHYNCPVVAYYPELLKANMSMLNENNFIYPYIDLNRPDNVASLLAISLSKYGVSLKEAKKAVAKGYEALDSYHKAIEKKGKELIEYARERNLPIAVLAGRPYHLDPEINHGVQKLISSLGMVTISEDAISNLAKPPKLNVLNQWTFHSRMYRAASYVSTQKDMHLIQLVSFGCGIDAITTDEIRDILEKNGKIYTQLKIDEISNLGAIKIRLRSLLAAIE